MICLFLSNDANQLTSNDACVSGGPVLLHRLRDQQRLLPLLLLLLLLLPRLHALLVLLQALLRPAGNAGTDVGEGPDKRGKEVDSSAKYIIFSFVSRCFNLQICNCYRAQDKDWPQKNG